jgi:ATP-binding cassette subfamily F protein 3
MVPSIRNILGGFLFSGDDVYKRAGVLSGGERTRLAVARMLLRPSNTLLLDEPTNHLDLDSKDVLLEALEDYGGTLIFVSHDRYFVEKLATKIVEIGHGDAITYPGTYLEFLWMKKRAAEREAELARTAARPAPGIAKVETPAARTPAAGAGPLPGRRDDGQDRAEKRRRDRAEAAFQQRVADLESTIARKEELIREIEAAMAAPGFYDDRALAEPTISRHAALMWEVGDLMHRWEELHVRKTAESPASPAPRPAPARKSRDRIAH